MLTIQIRLSLLLWLAATEDKNLENVCVVLDGHSVDVKQLTSKKVYGSLIRGQRILQ